MLPSVVIMSSILEHMCADVLQQTATQIRFPSTGTDPIPYWNLLPPKKPIKEVLTGVFTKVLEKGWVDSRSIHIFDTLLHMGGVYWFCNNLVKVRAGGRGGAVSLHQGAVCRMVPGLHVGKLRHRWRGCWRKWQVDS